MEVPDEGLLSNPGGLVMENWTEDPGFWSRRPISQFNFERGASIPKRYANNSKTLNKGAYQRQTYLLEQAGFTWGHHPAVLTSDEYAYRIPNPVRNLSTPR